jgi:chemotaxis protein histidine kinase CheA
VGDVAGLSGAAILGDGSVALILDVAALLARAIRDNTTLAAQAAAPTPVAARGGKTSKTKAKGATHDSIDAA